MKSRYYSLKELNGLTSYLEVDPRLLLVLDTIYKVSKMKNKVVFDLSSVSDLDQTVLSKEDQSKYFGRYMIIEFEDSDISYDTLHTIIEVITKEESFQQGLSDADIYNLSFCYYFLNKNLLYVDTLNHGEDENPNDCKVFYGNLLY